MVRFEAIPAIVARILADRPELSRPADLRERMTYQATIVRQIAEAHGQEPTFGLCNEVGIAYARITGTGRQG